jgi:hypothetical protein
MTSLGAGGRSNSTSWEDYRVQLGAMLSVSAICGKLRTRPDLNR